ncbi:MAG: hypothetical protein ACK4S0_12095 [Sediminibacterium sp.]
MTTPPKSSKRKIHQFLRKTVPALIIIGVLTMYFFAIPKYLEKRIKLNSQIDIQGNSHVEITGYTISIVRSAIPGFPYILVAAVEIVNKGDTTLEVLEVNSNLLSVNGKSAIQVNLSGPDSYKLRSVNTRYYDTLPSEIGFIIPPGGRLPIEIWQGALLPDDPKQFTPNEDGRNKVNFRFYWNMYGLPLLQWDRLQATIVVQPTKASVVEWYQRWNDIPVKQVERPRQFWQACTFDLFAQIDPNPIFDDLVEKYGNKGVPQPNDPLGGRILTLPDGSQIATGIFRPNLQFVITAYDKQGNFMGGYRTVSLEKNPYETVDADGYFQIGSDMPCNTKVKEFKVYLEVVP